MIEIIIPGDPGYVGACITADTRPTLQHIWARAGGHCTRMLDLPFFVRMAASEACWHIWASLPLTPIKPSVKWGWNKGWPGR